VGRRRRREKNNTHTHPRAPFSFLDSARKEKMDETKEYEKIQMKNKTNLKRRGACAISLFFSASPSLTSNFPSPSVHASSPA
jgi:hypothetical protein